MHTHFGGTSNDNIFFMEKLPNLIYQVLSNRCFWKIIFSSPRYKFRTYYSVLNTPARINGDGDKFLPMAINSCRRRGQMTTKTKLYFKRTGWRWKSRGRCRVEYKNVKYLRRNGKSELFNNHQVSPKQWKLYVSTFDDVGAAR